MKINMRQNEKKRSKAKKTEKSFQRNVHQAFDLNLIVGTVIFMYSIFNEKS